MILLKTNITNDFLVYVIEEYKYFENKSAKNIIDIFNDYNVYDYITNHYAVLHTMGGRAIVDDINILIKNKKTLRAENV